MPSNQYYIYTNKQFLFLHLWAILIIPMIFYSIYKPSPPLLGYNLWLPQGFLIICCRWSGSFFISCFFGLLLTGGFVAAARCCKIVGFLLFLVRILGLVVAVHGFFRSRITFFEGFLCRFRDRRRLMLSRLSWNKLSAIAQFLHLCFSLLYIYHLVLQGFLVIFIV